jgi:hypothetical protein
MESCDSLRRRRRRRRRREAPFKVLHLKSKVSSK